MLYKDKMVPGHKIIVRTDKQLSDGLGLGGPAQPIDALSLMGGPGTFFASGNTEIPPGEVLEIVKKPVRYQGINTAIVKRADGSVGHVYWQQLRVNCHHIETSGDLTS